MILQSVSDGVAWERGALERCSFWGAVCVPLWARRVPEMHREGLSRCHLAGSCQANFFPSRFCQLLRDQAPWQKSSRLLPARQPGQLVSEGKGWLPAMLGFASLRRWRGPAGEMPLILALGFIGKPMWLPELHPW